MARVPVKADTQIHRDVLDELKWDTRVDETDVGVEVDDGIVTLTGTVSSYAKRVAAQEAAHRVAGVLDVANDIEVVVPSSQRRTDTAMAGAVRNALEWDVDVPDEQIETTVSNGWVTLDGAVDYLNQRADAERAVRRLVGVAGVVNRITVRPREPNPKEVRDAIEDALERRAERQARDMRIDVENDVVTLTGHVHSWRDKRAVVGAAAHAPGVKSIEDRLRVDPYG